MTMLDDRPTPVIPLEEAIAALDSPPAISDRRKRALVRAKALEGRDRGQVIFSAGTIELDKALQPLRGGWRTNEAETRSAEIEAGRGVDRLVLEQCMVRLRAEDLAEVYRDPDRMEAERVWAHYAKGVSSVAWCQGDGEARFISRWRDLIADRRAAEEYDDPTGPIDARLKRLTGLDYPQLPQASWEAADMIAMAAERQAEYDRLSAKYGPRQPVTDAPRRGRK